MMSYAFSWCLGADNLFDGAAFPSDADQLFGGLWGAGPNVTWRVEGAAEAGGDWQNIEIGECGYFSFRGIVGQCAGPYAMVWSGGPITAHAMRLFATTDADGVVYGPLVIAHD